MTFRPSVPSSSCREQRRGQRQAQHRGAHRSDAHGDGGHQLEAGKVRGGHAGRGADEQRREDGSAAEARERQRVGEALAEDEQQQGADRPLRGLPTSPGSADCPENRTSEELLSVASPKPMASPAISTPTTGMSRTIRGSTWGRTASASHWMPRPRNAATTPKTMAHRNIAPVGCPNAGQSGIASENVPNPSASRGRRRRACRCPRPAARGPGRARASARRCPAASSIRNALSSGEPNSAAMAAKLPAAAMTVVAVGGASRAARRTASAPSPLPMRISGASGPRTTPKLSVPREASRMPGSSIGGVTPRRVEPVGGRVPADAGQALDRQGDDEARDREQRQRPPRRRRVEARGPSGCW